MVTQHRNTPAMNPFLERRIVENLADLLYDFLPGSGNSRTAFPLAAAAVGVDHHWIGGSKRPAIVHLLANTLQYQRHLFQPLISEVVQQAMTWRQGKKNPLTREEIHRLNSHLSALSLNVPDLRDPNFLDNLPHQGQRHTDQSQSTELTEANARHLMSELLAVSNLQPLPRGFAFEKFLTKLFDAYALAPRSAFRLIGEQIDGSFVLDSETYLLEAKWQNQRVGAADLMAFSGKVSRKASWTRGLFVSNSGFSPDGLEAFRTGQPTQIVCIDGLDLYEIVQNRAPLREIIKAKVRHAAETGHPFVPFRNLRVI